jgi:hypothetical protein
MELIAIDLILWLGFGLLLWALKDSFKNIQSDLRHYRQPLRPRAELKCDAIVTPQRLIDPIGQYLDQPIYRHAIIDGRHYRFDHVCSKEMVTRLTETQRWIAPGLVYVEAPLPMT